MVVERGRRRRPYRLAGSERVEHLGQSRGLLVVPSDNDVDHTHDC
jgi:hypothetical protein